MYFSMMTLLDLEAGLKVEFDNYKRFTGHDFLQVIFTFGSPRINNKGGIRAFEYDNPN